MVVTLLILAMSSASLAMADGSGIEPKMRDTHLPPITTLTIQSSGATSPASGEPAAQCADFKLSYQEIREYIGKAAEVAEHDYLHMLDWSPCYTSGEVTFKNGVTGIWSIQQYRAGSLKLSNGRTLYLYCPQCQGAAFPAMDK
ncbi:MAG TPA: hypothetical protein VN089_21845 [Duganella sp.]|nr:hypothetical protein [Duganella sp.]